MKEKTMREQDAFRFAREMVALYFGKRDMAALPSPTALWSLPPCRRPRHCIRHTGRRPVRPLSF